MLRSLAALGTSIGLKAVASIAIFLLAGALWEASVFGSFMYCFAVASVLMIGCEYGFTNQLLKDAAPRGGDFVTSLFRAKLFLSVAVCLAAHLAHLLVAPLHNGYFLPLFYSLLLTSFFDFLSTTLKARLKIAADFHLTTWTTALHAVCGASLLMAGSGAVELAYGFLATRFLAFCVAIFVFIRALGMSPFGTLSWKPRSDLAPIKTGAAYAVDTAVNAVLNVADGILLTHFAGNAANGTYQAAARLNQSVPIAFSVLTSFFLPRLGGAPTPLQFRQHSRRFLYLTGGAWLLIAALFGAAWILYRSFPPQSPLRAAAPLLPGLAAIALIRFLCGWMSTLLIARNMQRYKTAAYGAALVLIVISSAFSIEAFGSLGIVISYGMGFAVCFAAMAPATFKAYTYNRAL